MRTLNEALSNMELRRGTRIGVVSLCEPDQAAKLAEIKSARHKLIELDLDNSTVRSSKTANGALDAAPWRPLSDESIADLLATRPAGAMTALNVRSWRLLVKALKNRKLSFTGAEVIAVRVPFFNRTGGRHDPLAVVAKSLSETGFRIAELAQPPANSAIDMIYAVCERVTTYGADETRWHATGDGPRPPDLLVRERPSLGAAFDPAPDGLAPGAPRSAVAATGPAPSSTPARPSPESNKPDEFLQVEPARDAASASLVVSSATVAFLNGFAEGTLSLAADAPGPVHVCVRAQDGSPIAIGAAHPVGEGTNRDFTFRIWASSPEPLAPTVHAAEVAAFVMPSSTIIRPRAIISPPVREAMPKREGFGILVFGHTSKEFLKATLSSLSKQGAQSFTQVWLDGDQGRPDQRALVAANADAARAAGYANVTTFHGRAGVQKLMIHALAAMCRRYKTFLVLEEHCFPARNAVRLFREELELLAGDPSVLSIYGHHFGHESAGTRWGRFQNWGWATWSDRLSPLLPQLAHLSSFEEDRYLTWAAEHLTQEIRDYIDMTPGRQPTTTLTRYFDWSETLGLIAALNGFSHSATQKQVVFACTPHDAPAEWDINWFRKPPYNMIGADEAWSYY